MARKFARDKKCAVFTDIGLALKNFIFKISNYSKLFVSGTIVGLIITIFFREMFLEIILNFFSPLIF